MKSVTVAAAAALLAAGGARALEPTKVTAAACDGATPATAWTVTAPPTTTPSTPRFDVELSTAAFAGAGQQHFELTGSLGLPDHPLGVFAFEANGTACGQQVAYVNNGVLGQVLLGFPECPWASQGAVNVSVHVDVWTVLPVIPPLLSTGFEFDLHVADDDTAKQEQMCLKLDLAQPPGTGSEKSQDVCLMDDPTKAAPTPYPPTDAAHQLPMVTVDLDEPAATRWSKIVVPRKEAIKDLVETFTDLIMKKNGTARVLVELLLNGVAEKEMERMPKDYADEIKGISKATGIGVGSLWVLNMMYEITGACTSFVAQTDDGQIWHGRNLDFGLFMGTDADRHTWLLTEKLRTVLVNVQFTRGGSVLYNSTTYAGFIGLLSGAKGGSFGITVNTRFDGTFLDGLIGWFLGMNDDCQFLTFQTRMAMEDNETYADALSSLLSYKPLGPAYIIVSGTKAAEGAVIAKEFNATAEEHGDPMHNHDVWFLNESLAKGSFYVAETNYDRKKAPPSFDDRRYPMENCLETVGAAGVTPASIWKILSSNPTFNGLTTFSTIMSAGQGHFEAYLQHCDPGPTCMPF